MRHKPHVGLVDSHAEGNGCAHHNAVFAQKLLLAPASLVGIQSCMIGKRGDASSIELLGRLIGAVALEAIDYAAFAEMLVFDEAHELVERPGAAVLAHHGVANVRPIKTGHKHAAVHQKLFADLLAGIEVGRCRQCNSRHLRPVFAQKAQCAVLGSEVVSPHGYAVRFINRKERHVKPIEQINHGRHHQTLRRHIIAVQNKMCIGRS